MRYVVESLPTTPCECPFSQESFFEGEFNCNANYNQGDICNLFTDCPFPPKPGECNGFIELTAALKKGATNA